MDLSFQITQRNHICAYWSTWVNFIKNSVEHNLKVLSKAIYFFEIQNCDLKNHQYLVLFACFLWLFSKCVLAMFPNDWIQGQYFCYCKNTFFARFQLKSLAYFASIRSRYSFYPFNMNVTSLFGWLFGGPLLFVASLFGFFKVTFCLFLSAYFLKYRFSFWFNELLMLLKSFWFYL